MEITPHIAQNDTNRRSAVDERAMDAGKGKSRDFRLSRVFAYPVVKRVSPPQPRVSEPNEREFANALVSRVYLSSH
jgi:hypothetical protein